MVISLGIYHIFRQTHMSLASSNFLGIATVLRGFIPSPLDHWWSLVLGGPPVILSSKILGNGQSCNDFDDFRSCHVTIAAIAAIAAIAVEVSVDISQVISQLSRETLRNAKNLWAPKLSPLDPGPRTTSSGPSLDPWRPWRPWRPLSVASGMSWCASEGQWTMERWCILRQGGIKNECLPILMRKNKTWRGASSACFDIQQ